MGTIYEEREKESMKHDQSVDTKPELMKATAKQENFSLIFLPTAKLISYSVPTHVRTHDITNRKGSINAFGWVRIQSKPVQLTASITCLIEPDMMPLDMTCEGFFSAKIMSTPLGCVSLRLARLL